MPLACVELQPSRQLGILLAGAHALSIVAVVVLQIDWMWRLFMCSVVLLSWWITRKSLLMGNTAKLYLGRHSECEIEKDGTLETVVVQEHADVMGCLMVLVLSGAMARHTLVLMPDSTDAGSLRRLRVWLRALA